MKEKEFKCAIYIRVGTKEQIEDNVVKIQEEYNKFLMARKIMKDFLQETRNGVYSKNPMMQILNRNGL